MYDPASRLIVTHRIADDRIAEARREHLLRASRNEDSGYQAEDRLPSGRSLLGRVGAALHHGARPATTHRPAFR